jgi:endoglycosylceramidase
VHVEGRAFRDGVGRQLLFRGYNGKVNGIFDVSFDDGRKPNYTFVGFAEADAQRFEELGFNVLRLPVSWSALEPQPQAYSEAVLQKIDAVLDMATRHHFYVVIDMHQDGYSKEIGEDGAPLWAIVPPPPALLEGPSNDDRRLTGPVLDAGFNFFANLPATDGRPLQDAFIAAVTVMVRRFAGNPAVLGYEPFNEPVLFHQEQLDAFLARFADAVHAIDRDAPVLFEPVGTRNQSDRAMIPDAPWSHGPGVYTPHIYTGQFSRPSQNGWESGDPALLEPSMTAAGAEATAWGTPLFVSEFGCDQSNERGPRWMSAELDLQDRNLASSTAWAWDSGGWGFSKTPGKTAADEWPATRRVMARTFPRAVAGDLIAIERPAPGHLVVRYRETAATNGLAHEVSTSDAFATDYLFRCDGVDVAVERAVGRASFVCALGEGEHTFEVKGIPVTE